ncbi:hypothetical protein R1flu_012929 [Riccia fluitans]|uniref:Uncharacterized protein n=1 Tax=Riccia fluitans TaxID=41844 RepID=A0ABD1ZC19_9MARC
MGVRGSPKDAFQQQQWNPVVQAGPESRCIRAEPYHQTTDGAPSRNTHHGQRLVDNVRSRVYQNSVLRLGNEQNRKEIPFGVDGSLIISGMRGKDRQDI